MGWDTKGVKGSSDHAVLKIVVLLQIHRTFFTYLLVSTSIERVTKIDSEIDRGKSRSQLSCGVTSRHSVYAFIGAVYGHIPGGAMLDNIFPFQPT